MGRYPRADCSSSEPNSPTSTTASAALSGCSENDDLVYPVSESQHWYLGELVVGTKPLLVDVDGELVVGTKPLLHMYNFDSSCTCVTGTHTKETLISKDEDEGYGTQKLATAELLESCELNLNPDGEESQDVDDRPNNITDEQPNIEEDKIGTETTQSSQQLDMPISRASDPGTSPYDDEWIHLPDKPACTPSINSSTEHRLKLLDTGQPPGEYNSTSEDAWCSECFPSESPHTSGPFVGAPVISSLSDSEALFSAVMPPCYFWDSETAFTCTHEDKIKISDVRPFYSMAGPELTEANQGLMSVLMSRH